MGSRCALNLSQLSKGENMEINRRVYAVTYTTFLVGFGMILVRPFGNALDAMLSVLLIMVGGALFYVHARRNRRLNDVK